MTPIRFVIILIVICIPLNAASQEASFEELKSQRTRQLCVHYLDGYVCLTQEQHVALEELLKGKWTVRMNSGARSLFWSGYNSATEVFGTLKYSELKEILSKDQLLQFESLRKHGLNQTEQLKYLRGTSEASVDPIKTTLDRAIVLEVQRMKKLVDLNDSQVRVLRVASKGAATRVLAERQEFRELLSERKNMPRGFNWVKVAVEGPAFRIQKVGIWNSAVKKMLTEQQYSIFLEDQNARSEVSSKVSTHSLAMSYFHNKKISLDEYQRFTRLVEDGIKEAQEARQVKRGGSMAFDVVDILINLDDERIKKSLTPDSWNVVKPILDRIRSSRDDDLEGK